MERKDILAVEKAFQAKHPEILVDDKADYTFDDEMVMVKPHLADKSSSVVVCNLKTITDEVAKLYEVYGNLINYVYTVEDFAEPTILELLFKLGYDFNCWTLGQINACKKAGIPEDKIHYLHHSCEETILMTMKDAGLKNSFIENEEDIESYKEFWPNASISIMMATADDNPFGLKCLDFNYAKNLANKCKENGLNVNGLILPIGLYDQEREVVQKYYQESADFINWANANGFSITKCFFASDLTLDEEKDFCFVEKADEIKEDLNATFGKIAGLKLYLDSTSTISESGFNLYVQVIGVKQIKDEKEVNPKEIPTVGYYLTDGVYGCLTYFFDEEDPDMDYFAFKDVHCKEEDKYIKAVLWGPTCDSLDVCKTFVDLPKLDVGDWIIFPEIGGHAISLRSDFNWCEKYTLVYYFADVKEEEEGKK